MTKMATTNKITDGEIVRARKMAARKGGVTRRQLAEALDCSIDRATEILRQAKIKGRPAGAAAGLAARGLVFSA